MQIKYYALMSLGLSTLFLFFIFIASWLYVLLKVIKNPTVTMSTCLFASMASGYD